MSWRTRSDGNLGGLSKCVGGSLSSGSKAGDAESVTHFEIIDCRNNERETELS